MAMTELHVAEMKVIFDQQGDRNFSKIGITNWFGRPVMVEYNGNRFNFDLEGRVNRIDGIPGYSWDWIERTIADDWIYYDRVWGSRNIPQPSGIIGDAAWAVNGRTDLPMLKGHDGLERTYALRTETFDMLIESIKEIVEKKPFVGYESGQEASAADKERLRNFLGKAANKGRQQLKTDAEMLHNISGYVNVLPPDTIKMGYQVILITVMTGCDGCRFCPFGDGSEPLIRTPEDIDRQIMISAAFYGDDLSNHNSVLLGHNNAIAAGRELLEYAARKAYETFMQGEKYVDSSNLFMFSTNRSFCEQPHSTFDMLEMLPFEKVYINIGWEAVTDDNLGALGKAQTAEEVKEGMRKAGEINRRDGKLRISGNFILGDNLGEDNAQGIVNCVRETAYTGQLYLSPLIDMCRSGQAMNDLRAIRGIPGVRVHLYTMQRM